MVSAPDPRPKEDAPTPLEPEAGHGRHRGRRATGDDGAAARLTEVTAAASRPLQFRERRWVPWLLLALDVAAIEASLILGYTVRVLIAPLWPIAIAPGTLLTMAVGFLVLPLAWYATGLYPGYGLGAVERLRRRVSTALLVFSVLIAWAYLVQNGAWSRGALLVTFVFALGLTPVFGGALRNALIARGRWGTPVVLLGAGKTGCLVVEKLSRDPAFGLVPIGFLDDDPMKRAETIAGLDVIGPLSQVHELANDVKIAVVAMPGIGGPRLTALAKDLPFPQVLLVPDLFGVQTLSVAVRDIGGVLGLEIKKNLLIRRYQLLKGAVDFLLGIPLFVLSLPILALAALAIGCVSPGSPFYRQEREGRGGRSFRMLKLRTMYPDAEQRLASLLEHDAKARAEWDRYFKLRDDPRLLPVIGRLLRRTSIDELPQLWHVLRREMSLVGPRPFPAYHLSRYSPQARALRRVMRPGLTGFWQVMARSDGDIEAQETLDSYYIHNWSLWLELYILSHTFRAVLTGKGAR